MALSSFQDSLKRTMDKLSFKDSRVESHVDDPDLLDSQNAVEQSTDAGPDGPPITLAVIGAGQRGKRYASYALANPNLCKVVAVAEPRLRTREIFAQSHSIPDAHAYHSYDEFLAASLKNVEQTGTRLADAVIVAVQDHLHAEVVLKCVKQGFDILCEKPMATSPEDCIIMADAVAKSNVIFGMGHVLRYSPYNHSLVEVLRSGKLGKLINVVHIEPVGHQHFAHSFVRGNWGNEKKSSFSLMTKSCHDMDIICHYLFPETPKRVSSFGSLSHFKKEEKPVKAGDATRCIECPIERECPYSAKRIYLDPVSNGCLGWPASTLTDGPPDIESIGDALKNGPYGQCVYESPNDVVDHQVVNLEFSSGATCSFTMVAFTTLICDRQTRLHFTHGEIVGDMYTLTITNFSFPPGHPERTTRIKPRIDDGGHGGGDLGLIRSFVKAVREKDQSVLGTDVMEILRSHLVVFAAEKSRREGTVVSVEEYENEVRASMTSDSTG